MNTLVTPAQLKRGNLTERKEDQYDDITYSTVGNSRSPFGPRPRPGRGAQGAVRPGQLGQYERQGRGEGQNGGRQGGDGQPIQVTADRRQRRPGDLRSYPQGRLQRH